jgi:cytoskeletal protein CcmA (bactofilin family)
MALWKDLGKGKSYSADGFSETVEVFPPAEIESPKIQLAERKKADKDESLIGVGFTVEGKIEGKGDVRIAGHFKGDVQVKGNLVVESGGLIAGEIKADTVTIGGHVDGNIDASDQVNLLDSAQFVGDLKAPTLTVASGSRMRGRVEFGWEEQGERRNENKKTTEKGQDRPVSIRKSADLPLEETPMEETRICPHCKATTLKSAVSCPVCRHLLKLAPDQSTPKERREAAPAAPR